MEKTLTNYELSILFYSRLAQTRELNSWGYAYRQEVGNIVLEAVKELEFDFFEHTELFFVDGEMHPIVRDFFFHEQYLCLDDIYEDHLDTVRMLLDKMIFEGYFFKAQISYDSGGILRRLMLKLPMSERKHYYFKVIEILCQNPDKGRDREDSHLNCFISLFFDCFLNSTILGPNLVAEDEIPHYINFHYAYPHHLEVRDLMKVFNATQISVKSALSILTEI